jgi:hypothetical protein
MIHVIRSNNGCSRVDFYSLVEATSAREALRIAAACDGRLIGWVIRMRRRPAGFAIVPALPPKLNYYQGALPTRLK